MSARSALISDVVTYNARVWLAGLAATLLVPLSFAALAVDLLTGTADDPDGLARRVLRMSATLEAKLDVHGDLTDVRVTEQA
ncbi:hypothetical protein B1759_12385 [Rubrivirga sp. SAORIC476]|uniref:hypothetical protein n=1 Tax=Rubrivirga sp. SAORIC476 TaxID=1961794 RepID=UPI000BA91E49|nr:hypothetical protein [Rubrivirga sp. SAORIC476]PAP79146.1 hypothetical protein B1759_12385 [Rubrivirga sp. SAORIC476]